ncbi:MAG: hypothetical protein AB1742_01115 [bacterium]
MKTGEIAGEHLRVVREAAGRRRMKRNERRGGRRAGAGAIVTAVCTVAFLAHGQTASGGNVTAESVISVSSAPNPAWAPANVCDGEVGPTRGWLGEWDEKKPNLWIQFDFPSPVVVSNVRLMQAGLPEAGWRRFSRPKKIVLTFNGDRKTARELVLEDREHVFQDAAVGPVEAGAVRVEVSEVFSDARIGTMAGFQEIEIIADEGAGGVGKTPAAGVGNPTEGVPAGEARAGKARAGGGDEAGVKKGVTEEERAILELLGELLERLEKRFSED